MPRCTAPSGPVRTVRSEPSNLLGRGMGLLDDAIREHLELKRRHGADPDEVTRQERQALGAPVRGEFAKRAAGGGAAGGAGEAEPATEAEPEPPGPEPESEAVAEPEPGTEEDPWL